jgi:acyl carrier protein
MTRDEILSRVRDLLHKNFEIDPARVTPEAKLFQDLELDSIDAIDMVVQLEELTGRRVPEEALRGIGTVNDVVSMVEAHLSEAAAKDGKESKEGKDGGAKEAGPKDPGEGAP